MDRDPKTGRFLPGNKVAVGNQGNRSPKWGNKNALKHGFFQSFIIPKVGNDGNLYLYKRGMNPVMIKPGGYIKDEEGRIRIRDDIAKMLDRIGYVI